MAKSSAGNLGGWKRLASDLVYSCRIFSLKKNLSRSPRTQRSHDFFVLESGDWVNIIPVTPAGDIVLIRQYRHGLEALTLEIPGGMVDDEDATPAHAARREMQEETGYDSDEIIPLGSIHPNPAIQNNRCHSFLAPQVKKIFEPSFDSTEETEVLLVPAGNLRNLVGSGQITHALVVVAFYWYERFLQGQLEP